jgi:hypothetical protein
MPEFRICLKKSGWPKSKSTGLATRIETTKSVGKVAMLQARWPKTRGGQTLNLAKIIWLLSFTHQIINSPIRGYHH